MYMCSANHVALHLLGAGYYPRHTHMLSHLPSSHKRENDKFAGYDAPHVDSPLWRADWGIKQWVPYLVGALAIAKRSTAPTGCVFGMQSVRYRPCLRPFSMLLSRCVQIS